MNIFEKAKDKEHIKNQPSEYNVSRNRKYKIKVSYIKEFWLNNKSYTYSIYGSDFENRKEFEIFLYKNFRNITKIISSKSTSQEIFILKNGLLHNNNGFSYSKSKNQIITFYYFIDGREYTEAEYINYIRKKKLNNLL